MDSEFDMPAANSSDDNDWEEAPPEPPTVSDPSTVTTRSLQELQSNGQRKIMDIVDRLRRTGLSGVVSLPQLVVCGDQSSGKSSVLEAITEIPFPRKENLCTRFATEIVLRRASLPSIKITITPDKNRLEDEQKELRLFNKTITDFSQLPAIIEDATVAMGLGEVGAAKSRAFSRDVLTIEICGPDRPQLTLVDLPGLIHATNKAQTEADKELILDLVKEYMRNPRTIILAVISAKNDFANQVILDYCKNIDPKSERTLGIVTKPDYLRESSQNEQDWIELAQNKNIYFKLGWHVLRNRSDTEMNFTFTQRNEAEAIFFSKGRYNDLARDSVGVGSLRIRLSQLLLDHLRKELPSLKEEMNNKLQTTTGDIERLGDKRATISEQRMILMKVGMRINNIIKSALEGHYRDAFFETVDMEAPVDSGSNLRRFRAVIQYLNTRLADEMRLRGQKFAITAGPGGDDEDQAEDDAIQQALNDLAEDDSISFSIYPQQMSRKRAIAWAQNIMERSRGSELKGDSNHLLISQLFWEQSQPWKDIALGHINRVAHACKEFVYAVLRHSAPAEFFDKLASLSVDAALANCLQECKKELRKILTDQERYPVTYNHYFTTTLQKQRQRRHEKIVERANKASEMNVIYNHTTHTHYDPTRMKQAMMESIEQDMDKFSSEEALDKQRAYYKDEMKYFVNVLAKQVIERHLVEPLPDIIMSPLIIQQLTDEEVGYIAKEPHELTQQRAYLESRKDMLEKGMDTFREAVGGYRR